MRPKTTARARSSPLASFWGDEAPFGLWIDGWVDQEYTHLVEASYAAPYQGGKSDTSDFVGETAAYRYHYSLGGDQTERAIFLMRLSDVVVPMVASAVAIWAVWSYPITEEFAHEVRKKLEARRGRVDASAEPAVS